MRLSFPEFLEEGDFFIVKLCGPGDKILDLVSDIPENRQTDLRGLGLNERQIEALRLMVNEGKEFTNMKYRETFKVSNQTFVRDMRFMSKLELVVLEGKGRAIKFKAKS